MSSSPVYVRMKDGQRFAVEGTAVHNPETVTFVQAIVWTFDGIIINGKSYPTEQIKLIQSKIQGEN